MESSFQPLVVLARRPVPNQNKGIEIKINKGEAQDKSGQIVKFIDKRNNNNISRQKVLENLKNNLKVRNELLVPNKKNYNEDKRPIVTNRKIVIPQNNFQEIADVDDIAEPVQEEKEESVEETKEEAIEETKGESVEETKEEAVEETKKESVEETKEESAEEAKEESVEETKEEAVEEKEEPFIDEGEDLEENYEDIHRFANELNKEEKEEENIDMNEAKIGSENIKTRLPEEKEKVIVKAPTYYLHNRKIFLQKLNNLFLPFKKELQDTNKVASCDLTNVSTEFDLLTHQKVVRDYLNLYSPYRGLLIFHGLGSGKTCTSIAMAEGMKSNKRVFVMTPASLKMNFYSEMKKCGDALYKKNQFWEFVSIDGNPEYISILSRALNLSQEFIEKKRGAWLVNIKKETNYTELTTKEQLDIDTQLNEMIRTKYYHENYNGLNENRLNLITGNNTRNPFDNCVVLIDEAHNFVSRIVNKLSEKNKESISNKLYRYLMTAENAKIIMLSGTPLINYPNELAVMYNILRGTITSYSIPLKWNKEEKINKDTIMQILDKKKVNTYDYLDFSNGTLEITRNPFGFVNTKKRGALKGKTRKKLGGKKKKNKTSKNKHNQIAEEILYQKEELNDEEDEMEFATQDFYKGGSSELFERYNGLKLDDTGNITNKQFLNNIVSVLKKEKFNIIDENILENNYTALPDKLDDFISNFVNVETAQLKNTNAFKRRILGLTSYFRSAQEDLLPSLIKTEEGETYFIEKTPFSDYQFEIYEKMRKLEADKTAKMNKAKKMKKKNDDTQNVFGVASQYRVFSRAYCNYVFPREIKDMIKDETDDDDMDEDVFEQKFNNPEFVKKALQLINKENNGEKEFLTKQSLGITSPKFLKVLENIESSENDGLHLIYSHFRTVYGVGVMRLVLLANGFSEFKLKKSGNTYVYDEDEYDNKPKFVLYTGTETAEEKELIRNIYNGNWDYIPLEIAEKLKKIAPNNNNGEIIKAIMITASGAEGINLKNTRFVHIIEPYWHNVRLEQVIGRARRICSHSELPIEKRNVKVFLYMSTLSEEQKKDKNNIELIIRDVSKLDKNTPFSTDETLFEIANIKQKINEQLLTSIKESAIDCELYKSNNKEEKLVCYGFGKVETNNFSSYPNLKDDLINQDDDAKVINWEPIKITVNNVIYALNQDTQEVYDFESYEQAKEGSGELLLVGKLVKQNNKYRIAKKV